MINGKYQTHCDRKKLRQMKLAGVFNHFFNESEIIINTSQVNTKSHVKKTLFELVVKRNKEEAAEMNGWGQVKRCALN